MQVVLLRVGIDTGTGGMHGPLFKDGSFEYIPIPDCFRGEGVDGRTYGNAPGRHGRLLIDYFPQARRERLFNRCIHFDPEFDTFTYGDPTRPKSSLRRLTRGSLLVFYSGLKGWDFQCPPALYIIGYFEVGCAGPANSFTRKELRSLFRDNFHVMHRKVFGDQKNRLVLVKGGKGSRLLRRAIRISSPGRDRGGHPIHRLSKQMQKVFGDFGGHASIQRSPPRWVATAFIERAAKFVRSLK